MKNFNVNKIIKNTGIVAFWICVWQIMAAIIHNDIFFAGPVEVFKRLLDFVLTSEFWISILNSIFRIMSGFFLAFFIAYVIAFIAYNIKIIEELLTPFVNVLRAVPVAAVVVIISIVAGSKWLSLYVTFMVLFPLVYMNLLEGLKSANVDMLEAAKIYKISWWNKYKVIYVPSIKPGLLSAVKTGVGMSFKSGVAAEIICLAEKSIGLEIYSSKIYFDTPGVLAWTITIIVISYIAEIILVKLSYIIMQGNRHIKLSISTIQEKQNKLEEKIAKPFSYIPKPDDIAINGLTKRYGDNIVFNNVSFEFLKSKNYCVSSNSGKGKTTLLRIISNLEDTSTKNSKLKFSNSENAEQIVSLQFQDNRLWEEESVLLNLKMVNKDISDLDLLRMLNAAGFDNERDILVKKVAELSGGMKKRIATIRALIFPSDVLLLDEPFTGLDSTNIEKMIKLIQSMSYGRTVIYTSHDKNYSNEMNAEVIEF